MRDNQLIGYGLVVGLNGTGDHQLTIFSAQSLANMLQQMGVSVPATHPGQEHRGRHGHRDAAAFAQPGMHIDVSAAAIGDAPNLQGGVLLLTSLRVSTDRSTRSAQGSVVTGGFGAGQVGGNPDRESSHRRTRPRRRERGARRALDRPQGLTSGCNSVSRISPRPCASAT